jgi:hypothetical protein
MKANSVGLSFGFLTTASHIDGEVRVLDEIDLFEISITPAPANADTRILSTKAASVRGGFYSGELPRAKSIIELRADLEEATKGIVDLRPAPSVVSFEC